MSFLGSPCVCGWSCQEIDDLTKVCERCHRRWIKKDWGWEQVTARDDIVEFQTCRHNRVVGTKCPHCKSEIAIDEGSKYFLKYV